MSCETQYENISIKDLEKQLEEARKALVDKNYKDYKAEGHLFEYNINFNQFLEDISYILEKAKNIEDSKYEDRYKMA